MVTIETVVNAISERAADRYEIQSADSEALALPGTALDSVVCRLKRLSTTNAGWRTILIAELPFEPSSIQAAFRWAADTRDVLPEPQTADLYMFLLINGITEEDAARIETDDRFCRKVVVRDSEPANDFLDRTFLASLSPVGGGDSISDPLLAALSSLSKTHPWTATHLDAWYESLLSGKPGSEVAKVLSEVAFGVEEAK
ncbi:ABC-three component system middle component 1 [Pseudomonas sp. D47]|uniref:ABC-three component system middle component 1 n=1 Tax=Pseudomonas sp. D47 TaxID=3159447 RepID=UPI00387B9D6A